MMERDVYDAVTNLFEGVPASTAVPVLCEALIHAINCTDQNVRAQMRDIALATITEHVDLQKQTVNGFML